MSFSPFSFNPQSLGSAESLTTNYTNASSINALPQAMACSINGSGLLVPINVTSQSSVDNFVGYANIRIPASATGPIIANGRLKLYTNTNSYPLGTALYVGVDANPTNIIPVAGSNGFVSGDYCIFLGVIVPNEQNNLEYDLALFTQIIGVL